MIVCGAASAAEQEAGPLKSIVEAVKDGAKGIGHEATAAGEDVFASVRYEAACTHKSVQEAPTRIGRSVKRFFRSPEDELESLGDWLFEPLGALTDDGLF